MESKDKLILELLKAQFRQIGLISDLLGDLPQTDRSELHILKKNLNESSKLYKKITGKKIDTIVENRGINSSGERNGQSKLTKQQVQEIREKYKPRHYTLVQLAKEYNCGISTIHDCLYKTWRD